LIEEFKISKHYDLMCRWYLERRQLPFRKESLPQTGFVADNIAAAFLVRTDTDLAIFDLFISDPNATPLARGKAIVECCTALVYAAREAGFTKGSVITDLTGSQALAERCGFKVREGQICMEGDL
jgi:hypothetical protein